MDNSFAELKLAVDTVELVDGHSHNIVALDSTFSYLNSFSEAEGEAISFAPRSISFKRNLREIADLYGTEPSLEAIQEYRAKSGVESITLKCFKASGISAILVDDGIDLHKRYEIQWHKQYVPFVGRILRIERAAEEILHQGITRGITWSLDSFTETFVNHLKSSAGEIFGFKSIAAYRSGLEINTKVSKKEAEEGLKDVLRAGNTFRITNKNFVDYIFVTSLRIAQSLDLPMQIHTGFGDKDLDLRKVNPLHLRGLLEDEEFKNCRIVLLHASYPYSKEASYLASVYHQVYLDFGLAVPRLSFYGMLSSVKELLHLAPINKVMFSTDGIAFAESFYLGAKYGRDVIFSVLRDACADGDLSIPEAVQAAKEILSENARLFYKIKDSSTSSKINGSLPVVHLNQHASAEGIEFVRIIWVDASGQHRCRVVPRKRFHDLIAQNGVGLCCATMGMSSHTDCPAEGSNLGVSGEIRLMPDLSTKFVIPWAKNQEIVLAGMHIRPGMPWEYCPRDTLQRVSKILKDEFDLVLNAGFENEFYLLRNEPVDGKDKWVPFDHTRYCSSSSTDAAFPILSEIVTSLQSVNIAVEQLHAESGHGQFEIALGYTNCESAADKLILTREVIRATARKHGLLATFVPKYKLDGVGSGSHVHLSLSRNGQNVFMGQKGTSRYGISTIGEEFMTGVLNHLPSILAFTAPIPNSYDRIQPNTWSGAYHCWGMENREAPIRAASPPGIPFGSVSNFEIKAFDGCANPHLGLAAIMAAGIDGLRKQSKLPEPIDANPDTIKDTLKRLPKSLAESVEALEKDSVMAEFISEKLLVAIKAIRKAEVKHYTENKDDWKQLIHHY